MQAGQTSLQQSDMYEWQGTTDLPIASPWHTYGGCCKKGHSHFHNQRYAVSAGQ
jgi:hypothetical protein